MGRSPFQHCFSALGYYILFLIHIFLVRNCVLSTSSMFSGSSFLPLSSFFMFWRFVIFDVLFPKYYVHHSIKNLPRTWLLWLLLTEITENKLNFVSLISIQLHISRMLFQDINIDNWNPLASKTSVQIYTQNFH